jgi:hypothetical protein
MIALDSPPQRETTGQVGLTPKMGCEERDRVGRPALVPWPSEKYRAVGPGEVAARDLVELATEGFLTIPNERGAERVERETAGDLLGEAVQGDQ